MIKENLRCPGKPLPPSTLKVDSENYGHREEYSIPLTDLKKGSGSWEDGLDFDILVDWAAIPQDGNYDIDVETESDYLTSQMTFELLHEDKKTKALRQIGSSEWVEPLVKEGQWVQRLKLVEDPHDVATPEDLTHAILRLRWPPSSLEAMRIAETSGKAKDHELCLSFTLAVRTERLDRQSRPTLMNVRWEGRRMSDHVFDAREHIVAALEFDKSVKGMWQTLVGMGEFAKLSPAHTNTGGSTRLTVEDTLPQEKMLKENDPSVIILKFPGGSVAKGWCYELNLVGAAGQFGLDTQIIQNSVDICTTNCQCDPIGTHTCIEESGVCQCKFPHSGKYCDACEKGHIKDPDTGACIKSGKCKAHGGTEDCSGHGTCVQRGEAAVCECDSGFVNDGFLQCARCADPLFKFPDCKKRSVVIEDSNVRCEGLPHRIPIGLFRESKSHQEGDPVQGDDGVLKWARRYRLTEGASEVTSSESYFKVPTTSVVRFFVDTIHTGALVKYRLFDGDNQVIFSSQNVVGALNGFTDSSAEIAIVHRPEGHNVADAPYELQLEFEHSGVGSGSQHSMTSIGRSDDFKDNDWLGDGEDED